MVFLWNLLACAPADQPFQFEMTERAVHQVEVVDASSGEPIQGAVVGIRRVSGSGQFLVRAVVTADGSAKMRLTRGAHEGALALVALHPDYDVEQLEGAEMDEWLEGRRAQPLSLTPR